MGNANEYERDKVRFIKSVEDLAAEIKPMWEAIKAEAIRRNDIEFIGGYMSALEDLQRQTQDLISLVNSTLGRQLRVGEQLPKDQYQNKSIWDLIKISRELGLPFSDNMTKKSLLQAIRYEVDKRREANELLIERKQ